MTGRHVRNILQKEWRVIFQDMNNILFVTVIPLLIVAEPLVMIWLINQFGSAAITGTSIIQSALKNLTGEIPLLAAYSSPQIPFQVLLLSQFKFFLLLIPTMIAVSFATFSIIEEKQSRSLEPLLATPVKTWELLLGKALSGAIPAVIVTWACAAVFFLGVIGSSRAKDAKNAQNMIILVIFPVFALIAVQVTGIVWFSAWLTLFLSIGIAVLDFLTLRIAVGLFQRESIVIKWNY
jgi:ABC-2 type transport system permease protein